MQPETIILIGSISVFATALILGALQVRSMNKKALKRIEEIRNMSFEPKKSIHEQLEETLAERKRIIEGLENK